MHSCYQPPADLAGKRCNSELWVIHNMGLPVWCRTCNAPLHCKAPTCRVTHNCYPTSNLAGKWCNSEHGPACLLQEFEAWLTFLLEMLPVLPAAALLDVVLPLALAQGQVNEPVSSRVSGCTLLGVMAPHLVGERQMGAQAVAVAVLLVTAAQASLESFGLISLCQKTAARRAMRIAGQGKYALWATSAPAHKQQQQPEDSRAARNSNKQSHGSSDDVALPQPQLRCI